MLRLLLSSRAVLASGALHAGLAAGIASGGAPHATSSVAEEGTSSLLEVEAVVDDVEPPSTPVAERRNEQAPATGVPRSRAAPHVHPFAVSAHEARPHDPSSPHDARRGADVTREEAPSMPSFTISSGGSMTVGTTRVAPAAESTTANAPRSSAVTYGAGDVDVAAKVVTAAPAVYPADAREAGLEADVTLEIVVDERGRVVHARAENAGDREFADAAVLALNRFRFSPAEREGRNVRVRTTWTVQFRLR